MKKKNKYYVVLEGRKKGIFTSWEECKASINGFPGAKYKSFEQLSDAQIAWETKNWLPREFNQKPSEDSKAQQITLPALAVDAACAGVPGVMEYRCVTLPEKQILFHRGPYPNGTNNIGEFLAIVLALAWLDQKKLNWPVYSDSATAISWVKARRCRTKHKPADDNREIFHQIAQAERWLESHPSHNQVLKWPTTIWGEIPADFGRK